MDTNSLENALNPNDSEATYRALRDSILQIYQFGTKIAKEANPENELQVSWELGDTSLMNWISDTHCYLSRKGHKLQFLARPSKLEIISFNLDEGDKLLICSDTLRQNLSDNEVDEILQESQGSENSCRNLLKIANVSTGATENTNNIVVMEVINTQKVITPTPIAEANSANKKGSFKFNPLWIILPLALLLLGGGISWLLINKTVDLESVFTGGAKNIVLEDTLTFITNDSIALAKANDTITKEFESEKSELNSPEQKNEFVETPTLNRKPEKETFNSDNSNNSIIEKKPVNQSKNQRKSDLSKEESSVRTPKSSSIDIAKEEENYNALLQQKERWIVIKGDLQNIVNSGNNAAIDKLRNTEKVLERIEKKLRESAKKLSRD